MPIMRPNDGADRLYEGNEVFFRDIRTEIDTRQTPDSARPCAFQIEHGSTSRVSIPAMQAPKMFQFEPGSLGE